MERRPFPAESAGYRDFAAFHSATAASFCSCRCSLRASLSWAIASIAAGSGAGSATALAISQSSKASRAASVLNLRPRRGRGRGMCNVSRHQGPGKCGGHQRGTVRVLTHGQTCTMCADACLAHACTEMASLICC